MPKNNFLSHQDINSGVITYFRSRDIKRIVLFKNSDSDDYYDIQIFFYDNEKYVICGLTHEDAIKKINGWNGYDQE